MNNVVTPFVSRYGSNPTIQGFQLYNELNGFSNPCKEAPLRLARPSPRADQPPPPPPRRVGRRRL